MSAIVILTDVLALIFPVPNVGGELFAWIERLVDEEGVMSLADLLGGLVLVAMPGLILAAAGWFGLRRLFAQSGPEVVARALGARDLDKLDFEEQQLGNVVEEMAIAADIRAPHVMLYDGGTINGAAFGRSTDEAVLVVSRLALDKLNRAQTQALCGHLIATVANGDMRIGGLVISVLQLCGLTRLFTIAMFEKHARTMIWRLFHGVGRSTACSSCPTSIAYATMEEREKSKEKPDSEMTFWDKAVMMPKMPFMAAQLIGGIMLPMLTSFLLMPLFALSWRARRYLADSIGRATHARSRRAVGSPGRTRPEGVGAPGPSWMKHLFVAAGPGRIGRGVPSRLSEARESPRPDGGKSPLRTPQLAMPESSRVAMISWPRFSLLVGVLMCVALFLMGVVNFMLSMLFLMPVVGICPALECRDRIRYIRLERLTRYEPLQ